MSGFFVFWGTSFGILFMEDFKVAVLVESANAYSRGLLQGIAQYLWENGPWNIYYEERALDSPTPLWLKDWKGDGIIVRSQTPVVTKAAVATGAKVVDLSETRLPGLPTIYHDYAASSRLAAEHLKEHFYQNFGYVGIRGRYFSRVRQSAFCEILNGNVSVLELEPEDLQKNGLSGYKVLKDWLVNLPKPCGIMVCYDLVGIYVIQACRQAEIHVPEDVAVVGVNNDELQCRLSPVSLTSVAVNTFQSGYEAARLLHKLMLGDPPPIHPTIIPVTQIVVRKSTDSYAVSDSIVHQALQYIGKNACSGTTVQGVAAALGVNRRLLERRFQKTMERTVHDEIIRVQMNRANELLQNTDLTLEVIAHRVGFANASYFAAAYKKIYHQTPKKREQKF